MLSFIHDKFVKSDFLSIRDFVRLQYEKTAKHEHTILRLVTGMELFMLIFGLFSFNLENPRAAIYLTLYGLLAVVSFITDCVVTISEKKKVFRTSKKLAIIGYFYFPFIVIWGLIITTLDVTHGGTYWVSATIIMAISVFLSLNPFYTCSVIILAGAYLCYLSTIVEHGYSTRMMNIIIFTMIDCCIILNNYFINYNNAYMEHKLARLSERDGLTGVNNRRSLEQKAEELGKGNIKSVAIVDMDNFKQINDIGGHTEGDEALLRVTSLFREFFADREIYRYGGDEFVILSESDKHVTAEKLEKVNFRLLECETKQNLHISGGVISCDNNLSFKDTLKAADGCLYEAKSSGKGRVVKK